MARQQGAASTITNLQQRTPTQSICSIALSPRKPTAVTSDFGTTAGDRSRRLTIIWAQVLARQPVIPAQCAWRARVVSPASFIDNVSSTVHLVRPPSISRTTSGMQDGAQEDGTIDQQRIYDLSVTPTRFAHTRPTGGLPNVTRPTMPARSLVPMDMISFLQLPPPRAQQTRSPGPTISAHRLERELAQISPSPDRWISTFNENRFLIRGDPRRPTHSLTNPIPPDPVRTGDDRERS